ncbi:MAG: flagellar hook-associated protein FlgK [Armatimonadetes bacterium]|nr:flagellar hook-associated protein FlgK [Armatimonadota bacterium]
MSSAFHGIDLMSNALRAFQQELNVTGSNIANVNTPGYSRQTVDLTTQPPSIEYGLHQYAVGNGVTIADVTRIRDAFLEARRQGAESGLQKATNLTTNLSQIQSLLQDANGTGISSDLDRFFNAWSGLASNPNDTGQRIAVQQAGSVLAQDVRQLYGDMSNMQTQLAGEVNSTFDQIDQLANKVDSLNKQIRAAAATGATPNDLLDQRDQAVQKLSGLTDLRTTTYGDGTVSVYVNQFTLVDSQGANAFPRTYNAAAGTVTDGNLTYQISSGGLAGLFQSQTMLAGYQAQLDSLANNLRTQVNTLHQTGTNSAGQTGLNFFNDANPQTGAVDFDLDPTIKANAQAIAGGVSGNAGDGGVALGISQLASTTVGGLGNKTFSDYYQQFVSQVGSDNTYYNNSLGVQKSVTTQIDQQIQSQSGVNLDDEMASMLRYQRSYQAAAHVLSIFDQVTQDLVNLLH